MTILDLKNILFSHFLTESTFNLDEDVAPLKLPPGSNTESIEANKRVLFKAALDDMVKQNMVLEAAPGLYILTQSLSAYSQTIVLDAMTLEMLTDLVNGMGEVLEDSNAGGDPYVVNKLNVTGDDVRRLCHICHVLLED